MKKANQPYQYDGETYRDWIDGGESVTQKLLRTVDYVADNELCHAEFWGLCSPVDLSHSRFIATEYLQTAMNVGMDVEQLKTLLTENVKRYTELLQAANTETAQKGLVENHNALHLIQMANPTDVWLKLACIYTFMDGEYIEGYNAQQQQRKFDIIRNSAPDNEVFFCEWVRSLIHNFTQSFTNISHDALTVNQSLQQLQTLMTSTPT